MQHSRGDGRHAALAIQVFRAKQPENSLPIPTHQPNGTWALGGVQFVMKCYINSSEAHEKTCQSTNFFSLSPYHTTMLRALFLARDTRNYHFLQKTAMLHLIRTLRSLAEHKFHTFRPSTPLFLFWRRIHELDTGHKYAAPSLNDVLSNTDSESRQVMCPV